MANASDRGPALGDGADEDGKFGGLTKPDSPLVKTICRIQRDITNRHARLSLEESQEAVPVADVLGGPTMPNSGPVPLGDPPVKYHPSNEEQGGKLANFDESDPARNWGDGKVRNFEDPEFAKTTPHPSKHLEKPLVQEPAVLRGVVPSPVADKPTAPCAASAEPCSNSAHRSTLLIRPDGVVSNTVADLPTVGCAADRCPWARLAKALDGYFGRHVPYALAVTVAIMYPVSTDPRYPDPPDSVAIHVLDRVLYGKLCESVGRYPRRTEDFPKDLDKALKLIWVEMSNSLRDGRAGHFRVRGCLPDQVICEFEESAPLAPIVVRKPGLLDRLLAGLKFWR